MKIDDLRRIAVNHFIDYLKCFSHALANFPAISQMDSLSASKRHQLACEFGLSKIIERNAHPIGSAIELDQHYTPAQHPLCSFLSTEFQYQLQFHGKNHHGIAHSLFKNHSGKCVTYGSFIYQNTGQIAGSLPLHQAGLEL